MQTLQTITDPTYNKETFSKLDRFFVKFLHDKRDLPFVYLTIKISLTMIPLGILLYMPFIINLPWLWWSMAAVYFVINNFVYKGPFGLMLHCTSHRIWFKKNYPLANHYLPWFIGPFFGQTPNTYYSHHIWMHHPENNLEEDESTTMPYKRDKFSNFLQYFFDFLFIGMVRLVGYFNRKNRKNLVYRCLTGEGLFILLCIGLSFVNFPATLVVFMLPFLISRFIMMLGNWTQHSFICQDDPGNAYKNSITCINVKYNHLCWNDGYHISHHLRPGMHWTQHPAYFLETLDLYAKNKAIVFQGIDFLQVFILLMRGKYETLAQYAVNINNTFASDEEFIEHMKSRVNPVITAKANMQVAEA